MIVKGFYDMIMPVILNKGGTAKNVNGGKVIVSTSSTTAFTTCDYSNNTRPEKMNDCCLALFMGSGNTPVDYEDYNLEALITNYEKVSENFINRPNEKEFHVRNCVIKNNQSENIKITEIGLFGSIAGNAVLIAREILEKPVVLEPGKLHSFTMSLSIDN